MLNNHPGFLLLCKIESGKATITDPTITTREETLEHRHIQTQTKHISKASSSNYPFKTIGISINREYKVSVF